MPRGSMWFWCRVPESVQWDDLLDAAAVGHIRARLMCFRMNRIAHDARVRDTPNTILSAHRAGTCRKCGRRWVKWSLDDLEWILRGLAAAAHASAPLRYRVAAALQTCRMSELVVRLTGDT
jgi:phosphoglycerate dehydrogenase-like enzyme